MMKRQPIENGISRREAVKRSAVGAAALAISGAPVGLALTAAHAGAQATSAAALQLAIKIEYLEAALYSSAVTAFAAGAQAFTAGESSAIQQILKHDNAHINTLKSVLGSAAPVQPAASAYDFSAGSGSRAGPFSASLTTKAEFLKVAQLIKDGAVRAYKGILTSFGADKTSRTLVMQIHLVESRHAAIIRRLRNQNAWIAAATFDAGFTGSAATAGTQGSIAARVYGTPVTDPLVFSTSEDNRVQGTVSNQNAESFDEPLTQADALALFAFFGVS